MVEPGVPYLQVALGEVMQGALATIQHPRHGGAAVAAVVVVMVVVVVVVQYPIVRRSSGPGTPPLLASRHTTGLSSHATVMHREGIRMTLTLTFKGIVN